MTFMLAIAAVAVVVTVREVTVSVREFVTNVN
jgi:hypothetical protein